jgi:hypothetical protein
MSTGANAAEDAEASAFIAWLSTFQLSRPVSSISDLSDGSALFDVLSTVLVFISPLISATRFC